MASADPEEETVAAFLRAYCEGTAERARDLYGKRSLVQAELDALPFRPSEWIQRKTWSVWVGNRYYTATGDVEEGDPDSFSVDVDLGRPKGVGNYCFALQYALDSLLTAHLRTSDDHEHTEVEILSKQDKTRPVLRFESVVESYGPTHTVPGLAEWLKGLDREALAAYDQVNLWVYYDVRSL